MNADDSSDHLIGSQLHVLKSSLMQPFHRGARARIHLWENPVGKAG